MDIADTSGDRDRRDVVWIHGGRLGLCGALRGRLPGHAGGGLTFRVDGVARSPVVVSAVSGAQKDAVRLEVAPPRAEVTLRARRTFKVLGELIDERGALLEAPATRAYGKTQSSVGRSPGPERTDASLSRLPSARTPPFSASARRGAPSSRSA